METISTRPPLGRQPTGLVYLFLTEMWERFCYFGMRAILIFYLVDQYGFSDPRAVNLFSSFAAVAGLAIMLGGHLADRVTGPRRTVLAGGLMMIAGSGLMTVAALAPPVSTGDAPWATYAALALVAIGSGPLKCGATTMVHQLYGEADPRREPGFALYYVGINLGSAIAAIVCGFAGDRFGWWAAFAVAAIGMAAGLVSFLVGQRHYRDPDGLFPGAGRGMAQLVALVAACTGATFILLQFDAAFRTAMAVAGLGIGLFVYLFAARRIGRSELTRLRLAYLILAAGAIYWTLFMLTGSGMNLYLEAHVDRVILGRPIPTPAFQGLEPAFAIGLGPVIAWLFARRATGSVDIRARFALGLLFTASAYAVLTVHGAFADRTSIPVLVIFFLFLTVGDLIVAPTALSGLSRLAPAGMSSRLIGLWYVASTFGHLWAASLTNHFTDGSVDVGRNAPIESYMSMFLVLALAGGATVLALLASRRIWKTDG